MRIFFRLIMLLIMSCYTATYVADIQYDPLVRIDKDNSLIHIDTKSIPQGVEARKLEFHLKNNLEKYFYKFTENKEKANIILEVNNRKIQKKRISFLTVPEEVEVNKNFYTKKNYGFPNSELKSKTTYTTYKKVPIENNYEMYSFQLSFIKLENSKKIEIIKAEMEVETEHFENNTEIFISRFIEQIDFQKEIRNTRMVWTQK